MADTENKTETTSEQDEETTNTSTTPTTSVEEDGHSIDSTEPFDLEIGGRDAKPKPIIQSKDRTWVGGMAKANKSQEFDHAKDGPAKSVLRTACMPFILFGRGYARMRDWIIKYIFSWSLLTMPLLGPLTWHWWSIDINILELVIVGGIFAGATLGGQRSDFGIATGIMTCLVLLPVARNNAFKYVLGISYERMIKYHRWCGYYLMVPLFLHANLEGGYIDDYVDITGTVAWIAACIILVTSFYLFRRYKFEFFYLCHMFYFVYIVASIMHKPLVAGFVVPGAIMYGIDVLLRMKRYWTNSSKALSVTQFDETSLCRLEVPKKFSYKAGQYAFVLIPRVSRTQWHPISFSSAPQESTMTFHIKDLGSWSRGVNRLSEDDPCTIKVDGPYGKVGIPYKKYKVVALFAAGAGITPMMSVLKDIYFRRQMGQRCDVEKVYFYWSAGKAGVVEWFADDLSYMLNTPLDNLELIMNIYARLGKLTLQSETASKIPLESKRRCDMKEIFKTLKADNEGKTIGVLMCGPKRYEYQIRQRCLIDGWKWPWTTKFHYHHETFSF